MKLYAWIILAIPALAAAQVGSIDLSAPALGYVYDRDSRSLRAIEGVPGAAALGEPMLLGAEMEWLLISPNRRYALGHQPDAGHLTVVRLDGGLGRAEATELAVSRPWFSPGGRTVTIWNGEGLEVWTGFPDQPQRLHVLSAEGAPDPAEWSGVEISDDGGLALVRVGESLWRVDSQGVELFGAGLVGARLLRDSRDVVGWRQGEGLVVLRKAQSDAAEPWLSPDAAAREATGFSLSADEKRVLLETPGGFILLDRENNRVLGSWDRQSDAAAVTRADGNAVFVLSGERANEVLILDGDAEIPQLMAVSRRVSE